MLIYGDFVDVWFLDGSECLPARLDFSATAALIIHEICRRCRSVELYASGFSGGGEYRCTLYVEKNGVWSHSGRTVLRAVVSCYDEILRSYAVEDYGPWKIAWKPAYLAPRQPISTL